MLIFGGYDGSYVEDVWALSLAGTPAWTQLIASGSPARFLHTAVYDTARDRIVIFGGANGTALNDVWALELSGTPAWSQLAPTGTPPSSRIGSTAIYVESDIIAIFGGSDGTNLNDAWILTLSEPAWTQINGAGAPPSRAFHSAVYEHSSERMVVFGGADGLDEPRYADVWSLSLTGNSWMQLETDLHPARAFHSSTHDTGRDRMVIFGGKDNGGVPYHDDTWQLSLAGNAEHWQPIATSGLPPAARAEHTAIYDPARERMIVFGGLSAFYVHNDLFELSLAGAPEWAQLAPGGAPSGRYRHAAVYDPVRDRMLVFGGNEWNSLLNEVWTLSLSGPAVWQQLLPIGQPPSPRSGHGMVYDSSRDRVIVFGGDDGDYLNDTWALSLSGAPEWLELLPVGQVPSGRCAPIVYDSLRDRIVAFGGSNGSVLADVWALNLSGTPAWNQLSPSGPQPPGRYGQTAFFDTFRHRMIMFGGTDATLVMHDTWALTGNSLSTGVVPTPIPSGDVLGPCYPNPCNPRVTIPFQLHDGGIASIAVYDVSGKHVRTLLRVWKGPGTHSVIWEGIDEAGQQVSSGVYFCRLLTGRSTATQKFVLLK